MPMLPLTVSFSALLTDRQTDAALLKQYLRDRDADSFTMLVRRHGPVVLDVCRRMIPDRHLAEDAFQAVFMVLARKAEVVHPPERLPQWLYGVAYRVSQRARAMAARRAKRERTIAAMPEVGRSDREHDDLAAAIDEAIAVLSEPLRDAVILCELKGMNRKDAARQLGIAEGTLSSRLASARKKLADILRYRGVVFPAVAIVANTVVPPSLLGATVQAFSNPHAVSATIRTLAQSGVGMLLANKLKIGVFAAVLSGFLTGGVSWSLANPASPVEPTAMLSPKKKYDPIRKDAVWERFASICGKGENSRKLFDVMMEDKGEAKAIREAEKSDATTYEMYVKSAKKLDADWIEACKEFRNMTPGPGSEKPIQDKSRKVILRRHVLQQFFLGSRNVPDKTPDIEQTLTQHPAFIDLMMGTEKEPAQKLFLAWLERRTNAKSLKEGFEAAMLTEFKGVLPVVRKQFKKEKIEAIDAAALLTVLGNLGEPIDAKRIEQYLDNRDEIEKSMSQQGKIIATCQLRDVAAGMLLKLHREDPEAHGFNTIVTMAWWYGPNPGPFVGIYVFKSDDEREAGFKKFQKWRDEMSKKSKSK